MKRKRFSVEQIVAVLKQAEAGMPVAELIRHGGISECHRRMDTPRLLKYKRPNDGDQFCDE